LFSQLHKEISVRFEPPFLALSCLCESAAESRANRRGRNGRLETLETKLNALIAKGEMLDAVDQFCADDSVYQEGNQPPRTGGKKGQKEYLSNFFKTVRAVNALSLQSVMESL
jgi:hypothetical protein